ncbi:MAG TPA: 50S ribosomal protein L9 [Ilumatobacteraceae bacterium]|nr:50S ribosomal protein L9 [Ilumatobacteraceae bacterium]
MKVILRSDHKSLGKRGDIVDVADGHARNHLLPHGLAIPASDGAIDQANRMRRARDVRDASARDAAQNIAKSLVAQVITIPVKVGAGERLYGSVTNADVAAAVLEQAGIELDRHDLHINEAIKTLGEHSVSAKLHSEVEFPITINVVKR